MKIEDLDPPAERASSPEDRNRLLAEAIAHAETKEANYRQPSKQGRRTGQWKGPLSLVVGVGIGLAAAFAAAPFVEPLLFGVSASDPSVYAAVAAALLAVAILAGSLPAW